MLPHARLLVALLALSSAVLAGCSAETGEDEPVEEGAESAFTGTPNEDIGQLFMVEHYGVERGGYADVRAMLRTKQLGALILWNPNNASGADVRAMAGAYAAAASQSGAPELFISSDHEERATQRFKSRHGFTDLVDGATLGRIVARDGNPRVCELQGRIAARELASSGMNMSLGTVSDIFTRDSGTPGMFRARAIGADPQIVASCVRAMMKGYAAEGHVVFVTKHFPGLGNASGNTDVDPRVRSYSDVASESETELLPYRTATEAVNGDGSWPLFGAMISHASYEILDASERPATLSPTILGTFLRGSPEESLRLGVDRTGAPASFEGIGFRGLTVSDAFWTWGATKNLSRLEKQRLMAQSFVAGMDVLMISKSDFTGAWDYFQTAYADQLEEAEKAALVAATGATTWSSLHAKFRARVAESAARIKSSKERVGLAADYVGSGDPRAASAELVTEYRRLTGG